MVSKPPLTALFFPTLRIFHTWWVKVKVLGTRTVGSGEQEKTLGNSCCICSTLHGSFDPGNVA